MSTYYILMADVIGSSTLDSQVLFKKFHQIIDEVNNDFKHQIISPLTITLGDEFQGIIDNLYNSVNLIFEIEERIIKYGLDFQLRYVLGHDVIETEINKEIAHGMLGRGLNKVRATLEQSKTKRSVISNSKNYSNRKRDVNERFIFNLPRNSEMEKLLNLSFSIYQLLHSNWKQKDNEIIYELLKGSDYKDIADKLNKDRSLIWRREKNLDVKEYLSLKELILMNLYKNQVETSLFELGETVNVKLEKDKLGSEEGQLLEIENNNGDNVVFKILNKIDSNFNKAIVINPIYRNERFSIVR